LKGWPLFGVAAIACCSWGVSACGSDDPPAPGASGQAGDAGASGSSGGGGETAVDVDAEPPVFDGVNEAATEGETRVRLVWDPASDDASTEERIAYVVYAATEPGAQDFSSPVSISPAGALGALISGLTPSTDYYFVVRAVDEAGNEDDNTTEVSAETDDEKAPSFAGISQLNAATSRSLLLDWKPATDRGTPSSAIRYNSYVSATPGEQDFAHPSATSQPGETSSLIKGGVEPLTDYYAVVRAVDANGNEDDNALELHVRTPEGVNPTFAGAKRALGEPGAVRLYWPPASDNVTEPANIVYEIYVADAAGKEDLSKPTHTSPPAATTFLVEGLVPAMRYFFIVRARDAGGNIDGNTVEVNARPLGDADNSAPTFSGVTSVVGTSPSTLLVSWPAASDDGTPASRIVYDLFLSDTAGAQKFTTPQLVSAPGATSATIMGLPTQAKRFVVVRARDESGNSASNKVEASGTTLASPDADTTPPVWGTGPLLSTVDSLPYQLNVTWTAASDAHAAADIRYHVCAEQLESRCVGAAFTSHVRATSDWGETSLSIGNLLSRTQYFVYVRAEDRSGNLEFGSHSATRSTLTSWVKDVQPILTEKCLSCHDFSVPRLKDVLGGYVDPVKGNLTLVNPGDPELSLLYRRLNPAGLQASPFSAATPNNYSGPQEPRDGSGQYVFPLSGAEDGAIRDWIKQGAFATE
jgi:hypothetical protein